MADVIRILHVDDDPQFTAVASQFLRREGDRFEVVTETRAAAALDRLQAAEEAIHCIVSDYAIPEMNGIELLEAVRRDHPKLPFILFTGRGSEEVASEAISAGVTDYLQKEGGTQQYAILANRVKNAVDRFRAEQEADRTRSRLEAITRNSRDAIITIDEESTVRFANDAVEELFGYAPAELVGRSLTRLMPPALREDHTAALERYLERGEPTFDWRAAEFDARHCDGDEFPISVSFGEFEEDGERRFVGIVRDIAPLKEHERALREEKARFETMVREVKTYAIFMLDTDGHIITWNEGARRIKGYAEEEILGEHFSILYPDELVEERKPERLLAEAERQGRVEDEGWRVRADGSRFWALVSITALYDETGELRGFGKVTRDVTARHERSERYESLLEHSSDVITVLDGDGTITYMSPSIERVAGYRPDELVGEDAFAYIHPDDRARVLETFTEMVGSSTEMAEWEQYRFKHEDGRWVWLESVGSSLRADPLGGWVINSRDVTSRKDLEAELEGALTRYRTLVEQNLAGIYTVHDGRFTYVNAKFCEITGYSEDELLSMDPLDVVAPDSKEEVAENIRRRETGDIEAAEYTPTLLRKDGERRVVRAHGSRIDLDGDSAILGTMVDITDQVELQEQLGTERELLDRLLETSPVGITIITPDGQIQRANRRAEEVLGLEESEITDRTFDAPEWNIVDADGRSIPEEELPFARVVETGEPVFDVQHAIECPDGSTRWLSVNAAPLYDEGGELQRVVAVIEDITDRREFEERLQQQNEKLEDFASLVSHDLRNPLTVAEGRLELARAECDSDELEAVATAHERMRMLIEDLLSMAREDPSVTERERLELATHVEECWRTIDTENATLVTETDAVIEADASRLRQLFENLLRNAVDHGGDGVTVTVGDLPDGFYVEDDGSGIPSDLRERIFEPGVTTSPDGTGFGLQIVKRIAEAHGWSVAATTGADGGARFEITDVRDG